MKAQRGSSHQSPNLQSKYHTASAGYCFFCKLWAWRQQEDEQVKQLAEGEVGFHLWESLVIASIHALIISLDFLSCNCTIIFLS